MSLVGISWFRPRHPETFLFICFLVFFVFNKPNELVLQTFEGKIVLLLLDGFFEEVSLWGVGWLVFRFLS